MSLQIKEQLSKMKEWLREEPQIYYCTTYTILANDELCGSLYLSELKQPFPSEFYKKILILWRAFQQGEIMAGELILPENKTEAEVLEKQLEIHLRYWKPRNLNSDDIDRATSYVTKYQAFSDSKKSYTNPDWGVYKGKKKQSFDALSEVKEMLYKIPDGIVLFDDWNEFLYVNRKNSSMQLLSWSTGA